MIPGTNKIFVFISVDASGKPRLRMRRRLAGTKEKALIAGPEDQPVSCEMTAPYYKPIHESIESVSRAILTEPVQRVEKKR